MRLKAAIVLLLLALPLAAQDVPARGPYRADFMATFDRPGSAHEPFWPAWREFKVYMGGYLAQARLGMRGAKYRCPSSRKQAAIMFSVNGIDGTTALYIIKRMRYLLRDYNARNIRVGVKLYSRE